MTKKIDTSSIPPKPHDFDVRFLKTLYEELSSSYEKQAQSLASLDKTTGEMGIILKNFESKNKEQDFKLVEHSKRIHDVEMKQAGCNVDSQIKGMWHHVKRLNAFMDLGKRSSDLDTSQIDTHAQRMQHSYEMTMDRPNPLRDFLLKLAPWMLIGLIVGSGITAILIYQAFSGKLSMRAPVIHVDDE